MVDAQENTAAEQTDPAGQAGFVNVADTVGPADQENLTDFADPDGVQGNKAWGVLPYLGPILLLVALVAGPKSSRYARFHANQGLVLTIWSLIGAAVFSAVTYFGFWGVQAHISSPTYGDIAAGVVVILATGCFGILWSVFCLGIIELAIIGMVNAGRGKLKPMPLLGGWNLLKVQTASELHEPQG